MRVEHLGGGDLLIWPSATFHPMEKVGNFQTGIWRCNVCDDRMEADFVSGHLRYHVLSIATRLNASIRRN